MYAGAIPWLKIKLTQERLQRFVSVNRNVILALFLSACLLLSGCSAGQQDERKGASTEESDISKAGESPSDEKTASQKYDEELDGFIDRYNENAALKFEETLRFDAQDKDSGYYRTEYRLGAWKDSRCSHGKAGGVEVDLVAYRDSVRLYAEGGAKEEIASVFRDAMRVYAPDADPEMVEGVITKYLAGEYVSTNDIVRLANRANGLLEGTELMLEVHR